MGDELSPPLELCSYMQYKCIKGTENTADELNIGLTCAQMERFNDRSQKKMCLLCS